MYPETTGRFNYTELTHRITLRASEKLVDGVKVVEPGLNLLVEFMGLDGPQGASKLFSWEGTIIWFNEAKEIRKDIIDQATVRVGRYPSLKQGGVMPTWSGIIMDTNPYNAGHWLDRLQKNPPKHWRFFRQPPGVLEMEKVQDDEWQSIEPNFPLTITDKDYIHEGARCLWAVNPTAENLPNLPIDLKLDPTNNPLKEASYYARLVSGKNKSYISVFLQGKNGTLTSDQAVIPEFDATSMISHKVFYNEGLSLLCGVDFGSGTLNPAAVFGQLDPVHNRWSIIREVVCQGMGLLQFADPAGLQQDGVSMKTYFEHLRTKGLHVLLAPSNAVDIRIECIRSPMLRFSQGIPSFQISPSCNVLIEALAEKWFSDVADALGYLLSGGGEHFQLVSHSRQQKFHDRTYIQDFDWDVFEALDL